MSWCGSPREGAATSSILSFGCTVTVALIAGSPDLSQSGVSCCLYSGLWQPLAGILVIGGEELRAWIARGDARVAVLALRVRLYRGGRCVAAGAESRTVTNGSSSFTLRAFITFASSSRLESGDGCSPSHPSRSASSYSPKAT
eukprot:scaffold4146_cov63-Phaeocystis_antarctica.AAC.11